MRRTWPLMARRPGEDGPLLAAGGYRYACSMQSSCAVRMLVVAFAFVAAALPGKASAQTPVVTLAVTDPDASEVGPDTGTFTVTRTGSTAAGLRS